MNGPAMERTCVLLFSGGLDSLLALRLLARQGVSVVCVHTKNCFHGTSDWDEKVRRLRAAAAAGGASHLVVRDLTHDVVALTKAPRFGHGKNVNACLDCRLRTLLEGKDVMDEMGADFLATGEVLGQRPMSQRRDAMRTVERLTREWGIGGLLLRPLSARLLDPTIPETEGWVDRERLGAVSGRSRQGQFALAAELGLTDFPSPGGGCLLTDPGYAARLKDVMRHKPDWTAADAELLKIGRHFRAGPAAKIVVGRHADDNAKLEQWCAAADASAPRRIYRAADRPGALVLLEGEADEAAERLAAGLAVYFSKARTDGRADVAAWPLGRPEERTRMADVAAVAPEDPSLARIGTEAAAPGRRPGKD